MPLIKSLNLQSILDHVGGVCVYVYVSTHVHMVIYITKICTLELLALKSQFYLYIIMNS